MAAAADRITVILPWGTLLKAVAAPDIDSLRHIASLCLPGAGIEIVFAYDKDRDAAELSRLGVAGWLDDQYILCTLPLHYEQAGLHIVAAEKISNVELGTYETTWAKRLAFGRPREVWRIRAQMCEAAI
jgi:16S rRNA (adenine(1408)-N(1))-methyltransferase